MAAAGRRLPGGDNSNITRRIAAMYDEYVARMAQQQLLDFDDLLHHCLALLLNNTEVRHGKFAMCVARREKKVHLAMYTNKHCNKTPCKHTALVCISVFAASCTQE